MEICGTNSMTNALQTKLSKRIKGIISCTIRTVEDEYMPKLKKILTVIIDTDAFDWVQEYEEEFFTFDNPKDFAEGETPYTIDDLVTEIARTYSNDIQNKFFHS